MRARGHARIILTVVRGPHEARDFVFEQHHNLIVGRGKLARFRLPDNH